MMMMMMTMWWRHRHLALIRSIQVELNEMGAVTKALPHLARPCDRVAKEVLAFISIMLFNANEPVQVAMCLSVRLSDRL